MRPVALVTGASAGLGTEFAEQLARRGYDLVLLARSEDRLRRLAAHLTGSHGVECTVLAADLADPDTPARVADDLARRGIVVHTLVNNAGFGSVGRFEDIGAGVDQTQVMVNVAALVGLTRALIPDMLAGGAGAVINVASTAAFQPSPYFATYSAGKTFVLNFSLALRQEYRGRGVKVLCVCPGATKTEFFDEIGTKAAIGPMMSASTVVGTALKALDRDRAYVTPGLRNSLNAHLLPRRPRTLVAAIAKLVTRSAA
ncbi:SDR family NAD(P)-dependent oxidoreductase [Actinokineospora enzanensis]|uniref:SDR family NAD(P)-dependent oxidoreductase n=1 Tax=Actinokineospora enzanensis TaxID=155975 RepID=UPI00036741AA|nr:SDR family oxidoreductase [Actinokineospora enzanensis]